jgi:hypothetical protein
MNTFSSKLLGISLIVVALAMLGIDIVIVAQDFSDFKAPSSVGFAPTNRAAIVTGTYVLFIGAVLLLSYIFPGGCFLFRWITTLCGTKKGSKCIELIVISIMSMSMGVIMLLTGLFGAY